jgi:secreted trypsin-like serine protease
LQPTGTILPLRLPSIDDPTTFAGEIGTLSGWGFRDTRTRHDPNVLYFINEEILSNEECAIQNENPAYPPTKSSEICISTQNGKTACPGDSGSPLIVRNGTVGEILVGITSYVDLNTTCNAETAGPVVFMRVSYFMDWIEEKTGLKF